MKKLILLISALCSFLVFAQDDPLTEEKPSPSGAVEQLEADPNGAEEGSDSADDDKLAVENNNSEKQESSNSRFIPTEQISQDLGVSFPVDI